MDGLQTSKTSKKTRSSISVEISGFGVAPETVRASDLAELITNFQDAITETAIEKGHLSADLPPNEAEVSLVSVGEGSELLGIALVPSVVDSTNEIFGALASKNLNGINIGTYFSINRIYKQALRMKWQIKVAGDSDFSFGEVTISANAPLPAQKIRTAKGGTTIYGKLMRYGNANPTAIIVLDDGCRVTVEMSREMVKDLETRQRLFDRVGFEGIATWSLRDWKIVEFQASRITAFERSGDYLNIMFDELAKVSEGRWEGVDPVEFVNRLRGRNRQ